MTATVPARLVGQRVRRQDGDAHLTGRAVYTGDVTLPGTTYAALVRSPHAHARIVAAARALPGVVAVDEGGRR